MIIEYADIRIHPGREAEFEAAIRHALDTVVSQAEGYLGSEVLHGIESPDRYALHIHWTSVEAHMTGFRDSPRFAEWRAIVGPFFAQPPVVEHYTAAVPLDR